MSQKLLPGIVVCAAVLLAFAMLTFQQVGDAAPPGARAPFVDAGVQRQEIIRELQDIKSLLKEQNALLRARLAPHAPVERPAR